MVGYYWAADSGTCCTWGIWTSSNCTTYIADSASNTIWGTWSGDTLRINPTTSSTCWSNWIFYGDGTVVPGQINGQQVQPLPEEERQRYEQERIRMEELARERKRKVKEAEEKALQLLLENLTENQAEIFKLIGAIPVECQSGRKYHIRKGISGNVHELNEKGETARRLCFHPTDCPVYDVMLVQKLMLESCEEDARKIANFS